MFLLRCAFWLAVVYAAMFSGVLRDAPRRDAATIPPASADARPVGVDGTAAARAAAGVAELCGGRELDCLRDAAALTALVRATLSEEPGEEPEGDRASPGAARPAAVGVPMPPADPRRRGRLTRPL